MRIIETTGILNLIKNVPKELLAKLNLSTNIEEASLGRIELVILYSEPFIQVKAFVEGLGGTAEELGYGYAIVNIDSSKIIELAQSTGIQYIEVPKSLSLTDEGSNRAACVQRARETYGIEGTGVVIGFIDSGIDFTHPAFRTVDGGTRIEYIYDLSLSDGAKEYNKEEINNALKQNDPYSVVPVYDVTEHGTHVVGIACAGGNIDKRYYGVAPRSSIMMVKTGRGLFSLSTQIMRGVKFLVDKSKQLGMPLVINMSVSTNDGAHDGKSLLEQYINTIATHERVTIVIAAGNEGDAAHHVGGEMQNVNTISFNVAEDETAVFFNIYKSVLPNISIELIAPTGVSTGEIVIEEGYKEGVISRNKYRIFTSGPKPFDMIGDILVSLISSGNYILSGEWRLIIRKLDNYEGRFDIWLPISEGLSQKTKFLQPTLDNTLGIPATVSSVISVGSYNYVTRNISTFSGRGRTDIYFENKPEMVAPGEGITSAAPNSSYDTKTGTSMAAPHVSGICALIMEWGIVRGNDPYLYGDRLKYFLAVACKRGRRDVLYPNTSWGYGEVCAYDALDNIVNILNIIEDNRSRGKKIYRQQKKFNTIEEYIEQFIESNEIQGVLVEFSNRDKFLTLNNRPNITAVAFNDAYGVIYLPTSEIEGITDYVIQIVDDINPPVYTLNNETPAEASNALFYHNNPYLTLNGQGVLLGIIDTGIDYLNTEFQKEDDTTRIIRIWDQTIENDDSYIYGLKFGREYKEEQINEAIRTQKNGGDPYSVVPTKDENGHGTMVAGLAAARGKNIEVVGVAPNCDMAIVKIKPANKLILAAAGVNTEEKYGYDSVNVFTAIRYLSKLASSLRKPVVILLSLGTNTGEHSGQNIVSGFINEFSRQSASICVVGTGNEGDTDTHTEGRVERTGEVDTLEIRVGKNQNTLNFEIWVKKPDIIAVSVVSPSGEVVDKIPTKSKGRRNIKFLYEGTVMSIGYYIPYRNTGNELIIVRAINLREGIWQFKLHGEYIVDGKYWSWIPQRSLLDKDTKFLRPTQYTTLTIPSDANQALSVAYYNQNNDSTVGGSGRGYTSDERIKPDIAAGGINAPVIKANGGVGVASGSSVGGAIAAGICLLLLQWAVIDGNQPQIYAEQIISYIIRGAKTRVGDTYPNREWGYGIIDMTGTLNAIRGEYRSNSIDNDDRFEEYSIGDLFIRKPL